MANVRIDQYPLKPNPVSADYVLIQDSEDLNVDGIRKYKKCLASSMPEVNNNVGSYTYAQMEQLISDSDLTLGAQYLILDATAAEINLIVKAASVNSLHCDAIDPLYNNDKVMYNFASDEVYEVEVNSYASFLKYSALNTCNKIGFGASEIDLTSNTLNLNSNVEYYFNNTTLIHTSNNIKFISAVEIENFIISGKLNIIGTRITNETNTTEIGIYIDNCDNYIIENVTITNIRGYAINLDSNSAPNIRGNKGKFSNINLDNNNYPIYIDAGSGAEYNLFTNISASGNENAFSVYGGNNMFVNCNIVDNTKGVYLGSGANHAHGIFNGCNINHNADYNLYIEDVTLGQNFNGCHFYGDSVGGLGKITIDNSRGININNGHIDSYIEVINGVNSGLNYISNNFIDGTYTSLNGDGLSKLVLKGNFTGTAPSSINTISSSYVQANVSSPISINVGNYLRFNAKQSDLLNSYDATTGIFTAPYTGIYSFNINAVITGSGITASNSYIEVVKSAVSQGYFGVTLGGSLVLINQHIEIQMNAGQNIVFVNNLSGTSLAIDTTGSYIKIKRIE